MNKSTVTVAELLMEQATRLHEEEKVTSAEWLPADQVQEWADKFLPADMTALARYDLKVTGTLNTSDGQAWTGVLSKDGVETIWIENDGRGGSNLYTALDQTEVRVYREACQRAFPSLNIEVEDYATFLLDIFGQLAR